MADAACKYCNGTNRTRLRHWGPFTACIGCVERIAAHDPYGRRTAELRVELIANLSDDVYPRVSITGPQRE